MAFTQNLCNRGPHQYLQGSDDDDDEGLISYLSIAEIRIREDLSLFHC